MAISYGNQPSMARGHENASTFSQSNPGCNNLLSQNSIGIQGSHQSICVDGPDVDVPFHSPDSRKVHRSRHYVKWGIAWQPLWFMISLVLCGYALAIWHHLYFSSLEKTATGSPLRQQLAIRLGTMFAYAPASLFAAAIGAAYDQHLWTSLKHYSFSLNGLDDLFA
ncbi:hypothetical protein BTUL_0188g00130 [Botrytis tulipae]|uniref:Uncharacterized protein n=1 Tax=Botrytis tulipae TaxID=87230 RepID=A0A4Z1E9I7_9HELO|nr:hypothetical protein BTUL_0188g00130 [Botrytis tulipae]